MSSRSPEAGDVFRFGRFGQADDLSWAAIGRHSRNPSLVLMAPCVREVKFDARRVVRDSYGDSWTVYPEVQLCVHEADLEDGDIVPSLKLRLSDIHSKKGQGVAKEVEIQAKSAPWISRPDAQLYGFVAEQHGSQEPDVEQEGRLDQLLQARDTIEHLLHFGDESDTSKPALSDCSLTSIDSEHREIRFHWSLDPNREYVARATASGVIEIQQTYGAGDATSRDLQLALRAGTEVIDFDGWGKSTISPKLAQIIGQQFGQKKLLVLETTLTRGDVAKEDRPPLVARIFGWPCLVPAALAVFVVVVVSMSNYWMSPDANTAEYVVVSASVQSASAGAAAGFRGGDSMGGDILTIHLESKALEKTAENLTNKMTSLNALVTRRAISATNVNLMVAMPSDSEDAAKVLELFEQEQRPPTALLMVEIVRSTSDNR